MTIKISRNSWHARIYIWHEGVFSRDYPYQDFLHYIAVLVFGAPFQFLIWQPIHRGGIGRIAVLLALFLLALFGALRFGPFSAGIAVIVFILLVCVNLGYAHKLGIFSTLARARNSFAPIVEIV